MASFCEESCFYFLSLAVIREANGIQRSSLWILWAGSTADVETSEVQTVALGNYSLHFYLQAFQATVKRWENFSREKEISVTPEIIPNHLTYICFGVFHHFPLKICIFFFPPCIYLCKLLTFLYFANTNNLKTARVALFLF